MQDIKLVIPAEKVAQIYFSREEGLIGGMDCSGSNLVELNRQMPGVIKMLVTTRALDHPESGFVEKQKLLGVPPAMFDFAKYEEEHGVAKGDYWRALKILELKQILASGLLPEMNKAAQALTNRYASEIRSGKPLDYIITVRTDACLHLMDRIQDVRDREGIKTNLMFAAGLMALFSPEFVKSYFIMNVHPGDLTQLIPDGLFRGYRLLTGDAEVPSEKALLAGMKTLYSSIHLMVQDMDAGQLFMRGYGLPVDYNRLEGIDLSLKEKRKPLAKEAQKVLKYIGDHCIAGATFMELFEGNFGWHNKILVYREKGVWRQVPDGIIIEGHAANHSGHTPFARDEKFIDEKVGLFYAKAKELGGR